MSYSKVQIRGRGWEGDERASQRATAQSSPTISKLTSDGGRKKTRYMTIKEGLNEWLSWVQCEVCGFGDYRYFELHHPAGDGYPGGRRTMAWKCSSVRGLLDELNKCVVLCVKCHKEAHGVNFERSGCGEQDTEVSKDGGA